ncbi:iron chaperone [Streptomyces sp. NPDC059909]|uniref:iron chaperone n=1 Tax=Streptomyces sp. NPDC059909 TaxID=3346998 RepID=UPI003667013F
MPRSTAEDVDGYLAEVAESDRLTVLVRIRELCRTELDGYEEVMAYGMPAYRRPGGEPEIAFANQKQYISFYLMRPDVREGFEDRLADQDMGRGCLRFRRTEKVDFALVRDLLKATVAGPGEVC